MKLKLIAAGTVGAIIGATYAWAITADAADRKKYKLVEAHTELTNRYRDKSQEAARLSLELTESNNRVDELEHEIAAMTGGSDFHDGNFPPEETATEVVVEQDAEIVLPEGETPEETRDRLAATIREYTGEENADYIADSARRVVESTKHDPPFVIAQALYAWDPDEGDEYQKATLTYYENDRVLLDEDKEVVPANEIEQMVGWRNLNRFGDESGNPDVVFIRNRRLEMDFEVEREVDEELPLHVKYGMPLAVFETRKSAGLIKFREGDV